MAPRELFVLGTSSQVPTRYRNHNGYVLRWDDEVVLFDPGEGSQRQLLLADVSAASITAICITHFHGDHCLGLPGVLARLALDQVRRPVDIYFPAGGTAHLDRLRHAAVIDEWPYLRPHPVAEDGVAAERHRFSLVAARLDHPTETFGWRVEEPDHRGFDADRLAELGLEGRLVGRLEREGRVTVDGREVTVDEVSELRRGQVFAFVMDTRQCDGARMLADDADLLVCESTFLETESSLARRSGHLTARGAAQLALDAHARRLVLTHFSQRHPDERAFVDEARAVFPDTMAARDLARIDVPPRR